MILSLKLIESNYNMNIKNKSTRLKKIILHIIKSFLKHFEIYAINILYIFIHLMKKIV